MPARNSRRWGMGLGRVCATSLLGLWATINRAHVGFATSSETICPTELIICAADEVCSVCIDTLGSLSASSLGLESTSVDCGEWFIDLCMIVQETVCDATNDKFIALAACIADDTNGCTGFTTCEEVLSASPAPSTFIGVDTSAPTASPTAAALTESPTASTTAPSGSGAADATDATSGGVGLTTSMTVTLALVSGVCLLLAM